MPERGIEMKIKVPFMRLKGVRSEDGSHHVMCWPCLSMGLWFIRFSWEPIVVTTVALPIVITEEAMGQDLY